MLGLKSSDEWKLDTKRRMFLSQTLIMLCGVFWVASCSTTEDLDLADEGFTSIELVQFSEEKIIQPEIVEYKFPSVCDSVKPGALREIETSSGKELAIMFPFEFDNYNINAVYDDDLELLSCSYGIDDTPVRIVGHTDNRGPSLYNLYLANRRASTIASKMFNLDLEEHETVDIDAKGEDDPLFADATSENEHSCNRRVEIISKRNCDIALANGQALWLSFDRPNEDQTPGAHSKQLYDSGSSSGSQTVEIRSPKLTKLTANFSCGFRWSTGRQPIGAKSSKSFPLSALNAAFIENDRVVGCYLASFKTRTR